MSSTSDNLRLKQPCATIIERLDMEKVKLVSSIRADE